MSFCFTKTFEKIRLNRNLKAILLLVKMVLKNKKNNNTFAIYFPCNGLVIDLVYPNPI